MSRLRTAEAGSGTVKVYGVDVGAVWHACSVTDEEPIREQHEDNEDEPAEVEDPEVRYPTGAAEARDDSEDAREMIGPPGNSEAPEVEF